MTHKPFGGSKTPKEITTTHITTADNNRQKTLESQCGSQSSVCSIGVVVVPFTIKAQTTTPHTRCNDNTRCR